MSSEDVPDYVQWEEDITQVFQDHVSISPMLQLPLGVTVSLRTTASYQPVTVGQWPLRSLECRKWPRFWGTCEYLLAREKRWILFQLFLSHLEGIYSALRYQRIYHSSDWNEYLVVSRSRIWSVDQSCARVWSGMRRVTPFTAIYTNTKYKLRLPFASSMSYGPTVTFRQVVGPLGPGLQELLTFIKTVKLIIVLLRQERLQMVPGRFQQQFAQGDEDR